MIKTTVTIVVSILFQTAFGATTSEVDHLGDGTFLTSVEYDDGNKYYTAGSWCKNNYNSVMPTVAQQDADLKIYYLEMDMNYMSRAQYHTECSITDGDSVSTTNLDGQMNSIANVTKRDWCVHDLSFQNTTGDLLGLDYCITPNETPS